MTQKQKYDARRAPSGSFKGKDVLLEQFPICHSNEDLDTFAAERMKRWPKPDSGKISDAKLLALNKYVEWLAEDITKNGGRVSLGIIGMAENEIGIAVILEEIFGKVGNRIELSAALCFLDFDGAITTPFESHELLQHKSMKLMPNNNNHLHLFCHGSGTQTSIYDIDLAKRTIHLLPVRLLSGTEIIFTSGDV
ncbi:MAG: hypothetical protein WCT31_00380 [Candidatus Micrarchaeia archaeon]|jgi:hypothetical protein